MSLSRLGVKFHLNRGDLRVSWQPTFVLDLPIVRWRTIEQKKRETISDPTEWPGVISDQKWLLAGTAESRELAIHEAPWNEKRCSWSHGQASIVGEVTGMARRSGLVGWLIAVWSEFRLARGEG